MNTALMLMMLGASVNAAEPLQRTVVVQGLRHPWSIAFLNRTHALVTEKDGTLQLVHLGSGEKAAVAGVPSDLDNVRRNDPRDNSGLFDVVLDPSFATNSRVYLSYSAKGDGGTTTKVVRARYRQRGLHELTTLLDIRPRSADRFHYGGGMVFGRDGKLYVTVGERLFRESEQPKIPIAQDLSDARGKIYRVSTDGTPPADNPRFGARTPPGMFASGIRAAQGLALHPGTGDIWFSEHGSRQGDEINLLVAGANYGWPIRTTGSFRDKDYRPSQLERTFTAPVWYWSHTVAPTGLCFYTGRVFPEWKGHLFVAGLSRGSLWRLKVSGRSVTNAEELFVEERIRLRNVKQGLDGHLYLLTDERNGRVLRVERAPNTQAKGR